MYVWVDALTNYLTGAGYPDTDSEQFGKFWPANLHIIGKDITRFHTVYWPAFLMSAGIELPKRVFVHGFLYNKGEKMSKSVGNVVDPVAMVEQYGLDAVRFFLLREISYGQDGSYSHEAIVTRINADLANELGNLAQRSLSMVAKNCDAQVPTPGELTEDDTAMLAQADALLERVRAEYDVQALHLALEAIWSVLGETNRYFSKQEPWVLRKTDPARMATVLYVTLEVVRIVGILVQPVMPGAAEKILDLLGQKSDARQFGDLPTRIVAGTPLPAPSGVFPRYVED
jgi:methionyl-tRNA synthetase